MVKKKKNPSKTGGSTSTIEVLILELFRTFPEKRYSVKTLISATGAISRDEKDEVRVIVRRLFEQRTIELVAEGKYRLTINNRDTLEGIVDMTSSGSLYVIIPGQEKDVHVSARLANHAMHGDRVKVALLRKQKGNSNPEGEVIEVIERSNKRYVGVVELSEKYAFIKIDSRKVPNDIFIPNRDMKGARDGQKVVVRVVDWPDTMKNPQGEIIDVLGTPGDNNTEMHAILAEFDLPYAYPHQVEAAAAHIVDDITAAEISKRRDFRGITTLTIDPDDAKDFDDALSMRRLDNGLIEVGIHIADVTHYVQSGDIVDVEGENRATSVYLVDRTIPMLPERLSNVLCSLRPNEEKLCFSIIFEMDEQAEIQSQWIGRTVICSDRRFTYNEAQQIIESGQGEYADQVLTLDRLAKALRAARFKNGSISFERAEAKFDLDANGKPLGVSFKEMKDSNQLIEEFMLLANRKVAEFIGKKKAGEQERTFIYRIHDKPNTDKLDSLRRFVTRFGYQMQPDAKGIDLSQDINKLMREVHGKQEENLISTLAIRTMSKAVYSTTNIGHYGLAFDFYSHFTSPIRRYPDMMVHRLLAHYMAGGKSGDKDYYEGLCEHSSEMEQRASDAERASIKYKMVEFMLDKLDKEFDGHISGCTEWGIYVELSDTHIEGMVSMRVLTDDYYYFDEESYSVRGRQNGRSYTLGDEVRIRVVKADLARKQLDFDLVATYDFHTREATRVEEEL